MKLGTVLIGLGIGIGITYFAMRDKPKNKGSSQVNNTVPVNSGSPVVGTLYGKAIDTKGNLVLSDLVLIQHGNADQTYRTTSTPLSTDSIYSIPEIFPSEFNFTFLDIPYGRYWLKVVNNGEYVGMPKLIVINKETVKTSFTIPKQYLHGGY